MISERWEVIDALYERGYQDRRKERDYDPRGSKEWQAVADLPGRVDFSDLDGHLDQILKASGSALKHYSMAKPKDDMRAALKAAVLAMSGHVPPPPNS